MIVEKLKTKDAFESKRSLEIELEEAQRRLKEIMGKPTGAPLSPGDKAEETELRRYILQIKKEIASWKDSKTGDVKSGVQWHLEQKARTKDAYYVPKFSKGDRVRVKGESTVYIVVRVWNIGITDLGLTYELAEGKDRGTELNRKINGEGLVAA